MPMVVMTGYPSSGKTATANKLRDQLESREKTVHVVREANFLPQGQHKNAVFRDSRLEKEVRSRVRSSAVSLLSKNAVVIVDASNYIKGFRYEIWCAGKAAKTTQCTVHCDVSAADAWRWNELRSPAEERYDRDVFDGLTARYEAPDGNNRWDSPLLLSLATTTGGGGEELGDRVHDALYNRAPPPPNQSTQNRPLAQADFLHRVDRAMSQVEDAIVQAQNSGAAAAAGDAFKVPGTDERVVWTRRLTRPQLSRARRQFIVYLKMRDVDDLHKINTMFVQYLNSSVFRAGGAEDDD